jgi:hypothetical protein
MRAQDPSSPVNAGNHGGGFDAQRHSRRDVWVGAIAVLLVFGLLTEARFWRPEDTFTITENIQIAEAQAWWAGRLVLPERKWDTALKDGRVFSHFPLMFTFIAAVVVPVFHGVPHWFVVAVLVLPIPVLAYALFLRRMESAFWGAVLAIGFVCGTSAFPVIDKTLRGVSPYFVNQTLAVIGLLIMLLESFGRRRVWAAGLGLIIGALSRQMTIAYAIPLAYMALRSTDTDGRGKRIAALVLTLMVVVLVPCTFNTLKFGHPLDSGYMHVYADRPEDQFARDATAYGIFSAHYVPTNLYYSNLGLPRVYRIEMAGEREVHLRPNRLGTGIWWTTPLLLWLFVDFRRIVREPLSRAWLLAAAATYAGLLFYHSTGYEQRGFNRYSLDYVPVLMTLVAPCCTAGRRWLVSVAMIAWSVVYFRWLI